MVAHLHSPGLYPIEVQWFNGNNNDAGEHGGANLRVMAGGDDIPGAILHGAADVAAASIAASSAAEEVETLVCMRPTGDWSYE